MELAQAKRLAHFLAGQSLHLLGDPGIRRGKDDLDALAALCQLQRDWQTVRDLMDLVVIEEEAYPQPATRSSPPAEASRPLNPLVIPMVGLKFGTHLVHG